VLIFYFTPSRFCRQRYVIDFFVARCGLPLAYAVLDLSRLEDNREKAEKYSVSATRMLTELSSDKYQSRNKKPSFLLHSTGNYPGGSEIDASLIYADYYYIEALIKYKKGFMI